MIHLRDLYGTQVMATTKPKLTAARIKRLNFNADGPAKQIESDKLLPAFGVRVYPTGRKAYVLRYGPTRRLITLGPCTTGDDLDEMRDQAQSVLRDYTTHGDDPKTALRRAGQNTVDSVITEYIEARQASWSAVPSTISGSPFQKNLVE